MAKSAKSFFSNLQQEEIKKAILKAELDTSGEVRIHIEHTCKGEVLDRAAFIFEKLKMQKTELRNGVLFYLSIKNKKFAILGDKGINASVSENFWDDIKQIMLEHFKEEHFTEGLIEGISMAGVKLKKHFPYHSDDINELSNEISFGKN